MSTKMALVPLLLFMTLMPGVPAPAVAEVSGAVIIATNSAWMKQNAAVVSGDLVVNDASPGPYLTTGNELTIGLGTTIPPGSAVKADTLKVKSSAEVRGEVFCNELDDGSGTVSCTGLPLPVFATLPDFEEVGVDLSEAQDVVVPIGGFEMLVPGDYRDVTVKKNGTLVFLAPSMGEEPLFNVRSIDAGTATVLSFEVATEVRVEGKFESGQNSFVGPDGPGIDASDIVFHVAGINGNSGNLGATPKAAKLGLSSEVHANFYVPNGTLWLRQNSEATGAFLGRDVILGIGATATLDSAFFADQPPVADPQDVFTDGDQDLVITLTASDPESGDLAFSIAGGLPQVLTHGTLLDDLTEAVFVPGGTCSESGDPCVDFSGSSDCPGVATGETCVADPPPPQSATVTYDPATAGDLPDSFTFQVTDPGGAAGTANVRINPGRCDDGSEPPCDAPPPVATVEAIPGSSETVRDTPLTVILAGDAPCDGACDGEGADGDVPLTFSIVGGTPLTTANGGTVGGLSQGTEVPRRTAAVTYTPPAGLVSPPVDSFDFEACGSIDAVEVCDTATVTVDVARPVTLAEDQEVTVEVSTETRITLAGNPGGVGDEGKGSPARALLALRAVGIAEALAVGTVTDSDSDGAGDVAAGGVGGSEDGTDFETPVLAPTEDRRVIDPYVFGDTVLGIDGGGGTFVVGLVKNSATSACVDPPSADQKLGIGTAAPGSIGFSSAAVRATFPETLPAGSEVSVDFQTGLGEPIRIRLFDSQDQPAGSATGIASPAAGQCGLPGSARASATLTAIATAPAAYAVMDLDASTGGVVFVLDNFSFRTGGEVSAGLDFPSAGERRFQIELPAVSPVGLTSARVTLHTVKGPDDTLDTVFFYGTAEQDGVVTPSDFEAPAQELQGVVMPVPAGPVGTEGTFTLDVLNALEAAVDPEDPISVFTIQGRADLQATGQGLQVKTDPLPTLEFATPPPIPPSNLVFTVLSLPSLGTLLDSTGEPVVVGEPLPSPDVTFVSGGTAGVTSFTYQVDELGVLGTGVVFLALDDTCAQNGRPPGCSPPG